VNFVLSIILVTEHFFTDMSIIADGIPGLP